MKIRKKIQSKNRFIILLLVGVLLLSIAPLLTSSAFAEETTESSGFGGSSQNRSSSSRQRTGVKSALEDMRETAKANAKERAETLKNEAKARKAELRKDVCELRQAKLATMPSRVTKNATVLQTVLDRKYTRVQEFYASNNLSITNYENLKQNVDTAQASAQAAVSTLDEFNITIDCENPGIGQQLDGLRSATNDAKTKLKAYRKALVDLITAISSAIDVSATVEASGGTQ